MKMITQKFFVPAHPAAGFRFYPYCLRIIIVNGVDEVVNYNEVII